MLETEGWKGLEASIVQENEDEELKDKKRIEKLDRKLKELKSKTSKVRRKRKVHPSNEKISKNAFSKAREEIGLNNLQTYSVPLEANT